MDSAANVRPDGGAAKLRRPQRERNRRFAAKKPCPLTFVSSLIRPWRILILPYPRNGIPVPPRKRQRNSGISKAAVSVLSAVGRSEGMPPPCVRRQKMDHGAEQAPWAIFPSVPGGEARAAAAPLRGTVQRNAGELCFLWFVPKEVPARHEGYRLTIPQKVYLPGCAGLTIFRPVSITHNISLIPPGTGYPPWSAARPA